MKNISGQSKPGLIILFIFLISAINANGQRYLSDLDPSLFIRDSVRPLLKRFENLRFSGYIQYQYQHAESEGADSYEGGNFSQYSKSRFMLRRARIKLDYFIPSKHNQWAKALFSFQIDGTERGVNIRDMFVKWYENKHHLVSFTGGLFARPFGYEVNLSSAFREAPERGRMSQILMPSERDLGLMISFEPQDKANKLHFLKIDAGLFNGQGLSGPMEFDSHKDFISRITIKPLTKGPFEFSGGMSFLNGGWRQHTKYEYVTATTLTGEKYFKVDSSLSNIGKIAPRHYYGADAQVKLHHNWGETELRGELWSGTQPGTSSTTTNPGTLPVVPTYLRKFSGGFFVFLQNIINKKNQLIVKYDWYDPNREVKESDIGVHNTNLTVADIKYSTLGLGFLHHMNDNIKLIFYYARVKNDPTLIPGYTEDLKDNIFTARVHFRF